MKLSARNILKGTVIDIAKGAVTSHVKLDVGGMTVTASITNEAVEELGLKKGNKAYAVVKASRREQEECDVSNQKDVYIPDCPLGHWDCPSPPLPPSQ